MDNQMSAAEQGLDNPHQRVLYETARALAECPTLEEAAPRMVEAVCRLLGWQCGAIWEANRVRKAMHCVGTWQRPGRPFSEFISIRTSINGSLTGRGVVTLR